jgi:hypothetical protein
MIVKIEKPLINNIGEIHFLIYNEDKSFFKIHHYTEELNNLMSDSCKKYFEVEKLENGKLCFSHEVGQQNW